MRKTSENPKTPEPPKTLERLSSRLEVMFHPICMRILIESDQREVTAGQIQAALPDVSAASLYRHLRRLVAEGVLEVVGERPVRGTVEKTYSATPLAKDLRTESGLPGPEFFFDVFVRFLGVLQQQFHLYMRQKAFAPKEDGLRFGINSVYLTPAERQCLVEEMEGLIKKAVANEPNEERQAYLISRVFIPNKITSRHNQIASSYPTEKETI